MEKTRQKIPFQKEIIYTGAAQMKRLHKQMTNSHMFLKFFNSFILLSFITLLLVGCSNSKIEDLQKEIDKQSSQYEELKKDYDNLVAEYRDVLEERDDLQIALQNSEGQQAVIDDLNGQLASFQSLQGQYDALAAENESLRSQIASLQSAQSNVSVNSNANVQPQASSGGETMVWLSESGSKYHSINNCGRMNPNKARQVSQSSAEASGYGRCSKCF